MIGPRLYRILLLAYPRAFRERYGAELADGFEYLHRSASGDGLPTLVRFWGWTLVDTLGSGLRERLSARGYRSRGGGGVRLPSRGLRALFADLVLDTTYAARSLKKSPGYMIAIVITLALGIGANTALFSAAWGVFGRPLPFAQGNELVRLSATRPDWQAGDVGDDEQPFSVAEIGDLRGLPGFEDLAEYHGMSFTMIGPDGPDLVEAAVVSSNYFDFLGMEPMLGRLFDPAEDHMGAHPVVVLSFEYWKERFDSDPDVVGDTVRMNGEEHRIVGVLPQIPQFPDRNDIFLPISVCPTRSSPEFIESRGRRMMTVYARLDEGVGLTQASGELSARTDEVHEAHPEFYADIAGGREVTLTPLREELVRSARPVVWPLVAISALLLIIACANAAGLALARVGRRMDALAVRSAMGAGKGRLTRQLLTESVLLSTLGGLLGLGIAYVGSDLLATFAERFTTRSQEIRLDGVVLGFALTCSVATGLVFGIAPVTVTHRTLGGLAQRGRMTASRMNRRFQQGLVAVQVMIAFSVLSGAGLLMRSFWEANSEPVGFSTENVITARLTGGLDQSHDEYQMASVMRAIRDSLQARPSVLAVARVPWAPLADPHEHRDAFTVGSESGGWHAAVGDARAVDWSYFEVMGLEAVEGRLLMASDTSGAEPVVVVNETFRDRYMSGVAGVGDQVRDCPPGGECGEPHRIVGVVPDARVNGALDPAFPALFVPLEQTDWFTDQFIARVSGNPAIVMQAFLELVDAYPLDMAVTGVGTLEDFRRDGLQPRRFLAALLFLFAAVATGLALTGVFGVTALAASARVREMGIRRALGATRHETERLVLKDGVAVVAAGLVGGLLLTAGTTWLLEGLLWGVTPTDPWALAGAVVLFIGASAVACVLPARRAARADVVASLAAN